MSCYLVVAIAIDRCCMVTWPIHSALRTSLKRTRIQLVFTIIFALTTNSFLLFCNGIGVCHLCSAKKSMKKVHLYADFVFRIVFVDIGTSLSLLILTAITVSSIIKANQKVKSFIYTSNVFKDRKVDINITHMSLSIVIIFLLFRLPYSITKLYDYLYYFILQNRDGSRDHITTAIDILLTVSTANYAVNFILYCTFWRTFRKQLCRLFKLCCCCKLIQSAGSRTSSSRSSVSFIKGDTVALVFDATSKHVIKS